MIKKTYVNIDVVTAARQRIKNVFSTNNKVQLSISGGKDSICLSNLVFKLCQSGEVDKSKLVIDFIDEEAIYPCVERVVKNMRLQWLSIGVEFRWWCIEVKHFNCFNMLTQDENFICWDRYKKDVWIRPMPSFAIKHHPMLNERVDSYQMFLPRLNADRCSMIGVRASESIQRTNSLASQKKTKKFAYPIYDWTDTDVWRYIRDNNLEIPDAYMYMYQVGTPKNAMRISQFFSVDTARSLVKMCEFYPDLFNKICKREPNAYMAMLYFDTELFRRQKQTKSSKKQTDDTDYKYKVLELLSNKDYFTTKSQISNKKRVQRFILLYGPVIGKKEWKAIYNALVGGDPKCRAMRAIQSNVFRNLSKEADKNGR